MHEKTSQAEVQARMTRLAAVLDLARSAVAPMSPVQSETGFEVVSDRLGTRARRQRRNRRLMLAGVSAAAVLAVSISFVHFRRADSHQAPLSYVVEGGQMVDGGYLRASDPAGVHIHFVDGTDVQLPIETRGRLLSVDDKGARFAIEQGQATVHVTPRPEARWILDAGPFLVAVHGTIFTVDWDGASERLEVRLEKGLVSVKGPLSKEPIVVRAGQQLSVNLRKKEVVLREMDAAALSGSVVPEKNVPGPETLREAPLPLATSREPRARERAATPSWAAALAAGDVDFVLADAERRGIVNAMAHASSESLAALADAARYRRKNELARAALLAQRDRFPGSRRAEEAAFLLGRVAEANVHDSGKAIEWYDRYLTEAPSGAYASEALGRKMVATRSWQGAPAARSLAEDYLRLFPGGTYAGAARALVDTP